MTRAPRLYIVCYDICDPKRLRRVYKVMRGFGDHLQYSVFRCILSDVQLARLRSRLLDEIDGAEDQVLFVPLGSAESKRSWRMFTVGRALTHPERVVRVF